MSTGRRNVSRRLTPDCCLLTCEHAGNRIPPHYRELFRGKDDVLRSHRGWDPGSLSLGRTIQTSLACDLLIEETSRLLVEANRSLSHPSLFSEFTRDLPATEKEKIVANYYLPHRSSVEQKIQHKVVTHGRALHVGVHTFTPILDREIRTADVGLLYDPKRVSEREFCELWRQELLASSIPLRVRKNYPYRGNTDGLTTALRKIHDGNRYLGIELEVNQEWHFQGGPAWRKLQRTIATSLVATIAKFTMRD